MTVWVLPEGSTETGDAGEGDLLVRPEDGALHVARIVGEVVEWLGGAPAEIELPDVDGPTATEGELAEELEGFAAALIARGG